jgi:hypothetical protein
VFAAVRAISPGDGSDADTAPCIAFNSINRSLARASTPDFFVGHHRRLRRHARPQPAAAGRTARRSRGAELRICDLHAIAAKHWHEIISDDKLKPVRGLLAHWDGRESGHRLRRAARLYRTAAGNPDEITAFQETCIELEVLEKPLASMAGFAKQGTEQVKGKCEKCGHEFTRNKTTLVGARALVHGSVDLDAADSDRKADWKLLNKLRNDLTHGLVDENELGEKPHHGLTAAMHYLHHAICTCSHAPSLTNSRYVCARGGIDYVLVGRYHVAEWPSLAEWGQVVDTSTFAWVEHATHGLVPEVILTSVASRAWRCSWAGSRSQHLSQ